MTAVDDEEHFLSRWSRRKLEAKRDAPAALPAAELPAAEPAAPATAATVPAAPHEASAEYRAFFDPKVDEKLRQAALRGLFKDPHFNVMDGLDTYIDDYSLADPIPEGMLRQIESGKGAVSVRRQKEDRRGGKRSGHDRGGRGCCARSGSRHERAAGRATGTGVR